MTASLSHEMNQPLAAIMASAQASLRLLNRPQPSLPDVREALDDIVADSRRASQVIQRLYALFRKDRSERSPIAINELVTDVAGVVRRDAERRRVDMHLVLADGLPPVQADAVQIQQVVLNLLVNAIEAMAGVAGPRELTLETVRREAGIVEVGVRDTGVGVEASQMERIFEPFVSSKAQGLGMGLSISRSIVWAHEGRIWATRNAGPGITVHVELPCEEPT
jgi:signal transduction histidine kinase